MNVFYRFNHDKMKQKIQIQRYASPCGGLWLGSLGDQLCLCNWTNEKHPGRVDKRLQTLLKAEYEEAPSDVTQEAIRQLDEYFRRERTSLMSRKRPSANWTNISGANGPPLRFPYSLSVPISSKPSGTNFSKSLTDRPSPTAQWPSDWEYRKRCGRWRMRTGQMPFLSSRLAIGSSGATVR